MFKYFLQKAVYQNYSPEIQKTIIKLNKRRFIIEYITLISFAIILFLPFFIMSIIPILEGRDLETRTEYMMYGFTILYIIIWITSILFFKEAFMLFCLAAVDKIYFVACTMRGKAISKEDIEIIKKDDRELHGYTLYELISTSMSRGKCLGSCLSLIENLKKGYIEFIAVQSFLNKDEMKDQRPFNLHVIYANNGWIYDTYSGRQYPEKQFFKIWKAKRYKRFAYSDFKGKSANDFYAEIKEELKSWCEQHECSFFT